MILFTKEDSANVAIKECETLDGINIGKVGVSKNFVKLINQWTWIRYIQEIKEIENCEESNHHFPNSPAYRSNAKELEHCYFFKIYCLKKEK